MVLTESTAMKLYCRTDVVGESYELGPIPLTVTGVLEDVPANSSIDFDLLSSVETINAVCYHQ